MAKPLGRLEFISAQTITLINEKAKFGGYVETYYQTDKLNCKTGNSKIEGCQVEFKGCLRRKH